MAYLVFLLRYYISFLFQSVIPAVEMITGIAHVLMVCVLKKYL